jgi:hypothetical protein
MVCKIETCILDEVVDPGSEDGMSHVTLLGLHNLRAIRQSVSRLEVDGWPFNDEKPWRNVPAGGVDAGHDGDMLPEIACELGDLLVRHAAKDTSAPVNLLCA